jgi:hypothetical protein
LPDAPGGTPPYGRAIRQKEDEMATRTIERAWTRISPATSGVVARLGTAAAAATALSVAACASSQRAVDTRFVAKANAICAQAVARHSAHPFPLPGFDPVHPRPADLPAVGRYFARYGSATATTARLDALAAPTGHQREWHELRALINQAAANARRQITAAEHADIAGFEQAVRTRRLSTEINRIAPRLGFTSSSPCGQLFG